MPSVYIIPPLSENEEELQEENEGNRSKQKRKKTSHNRYISEDIRYNWHATNLDGSEIVKCITTGCSGTGKISIDKTEFTLRQKHFHGCTPVPYSVEREKFKTELTEKLRRDPSQSGKTVYNSLLNSGRYPPEMRMAYNNTLKKRVTRVKRERNPAMPQNLRDMDEKLRSPKGEKMLHYDAAKPEKLTAHLVESPIDQDGYTPHSLVFTDLGHLAEVQRLVPPRTLEGYCDSTFNAVPKRVMVNKIKGYQLLVFQVNRRNSSTAIFYALMERKRTEDYEAVFEYVFNELAPGMKDKLNKIHMDFELAEANALKKVIPHIQIVPCLFHFTQALWRNAKKKGALFRRTRYGKPVKLTEEQEKIAKEVDDFIRYLSKFPFAPGDKINGKLLDIFITNMSPEAQNKTKKFSNYVRSQWIERGCKPVDWSIYGQAHRTNNLSETFNRTINGLFDANPMPWNFVRSLVELHSTVIREYQGLYLPKEYDRKREIALKKFIDDYDLNRVEVTDFIISLKEFERDRDTREIEEILRAVEDKEQEDENEEEENNGEKCIKRGKK